MNKILINFCPTGVIPNKSLNINVPISPDEIASDTYMAYLKGVQIVHIHARDINGNNTHNKDIYAEIILKIKKLCPDIITCVSTTGRINNTFQARSDVLSLIGDVKPDMASLTLSSLNFIKEASVNTPDMIITLLEKMNEFNIKPELEVFEVGMINFAKYLIKKQLLKPPYYFNIILGNIFSAQTSISDINCLISALPPDSIYSIGGIGAHQLDANMLGLIYANGVRIGLEDNIYYEHDKKILASNELLLERFKKLAHLYGRSLYTCKEVKELLNLPI